MVPCIPETTPFTAAPAHCKNLDCTPVPVLTREMPTAAQQTQDVELGIFYV